MAVDDESIIPLREISENASHVDMTSTSSVRGFLSLLFPRRHSQKNNVNNRMSCQEFLDSINESASRTGSAHAELKSQSSSGALSSLKFLSIGHRLSISIKEAVIYPQQPRFVGSAPERFVTVSDVTSSPMVGWMPTRSSKSSFVTFFLLKTINRMNK